MYISQHTQKAAGGFFEGAQGFVVKDSNLVYNAHAADDFMKELTTHTIEGAEFDSSKRYPPPQCHPGTRKIIIKRMRSWLRNPCRTKRMLWLVGSAGVGKSAIMQTLAELESKAVLLVTLFFSAPNGRNDPTKVVITFAYRIAAQCLPYRDFVRGKMANDPKLPEKSITAQFKELIVEPFAHRCIYQEGPPLLMILDGLDECEGSREQCTILGLISFFTTTYPTAPLLWVVASRPEAHITRFLSRAKVASSYDKEEVVVNSTEACQDVERFLRVEFERIRSAYPVTALYPRWPLESDFTKVAAAGLGHFAYATTVIRCIEDPVQRKPISQLQKVLNVIDKAPRADDQVMAQLDALYEYILSQVPADTLPDTKEILSYMIHLRFWDISRPFSITSNWLGMAPDVGYSALYWLHSVLDVPPPDKAESEALRFHHKSFEDYLRNPRKSGMASRAEEKERNIRRALRILRDVPRYESLGSDPLAQIVLCWPQHDLSGGIRNYLYGMASSGLRFLSLKSLDCFSLPDVVHALGVMNTFLMGGDVLRVCFDDNSPVMLQLREHGIIQDMPVQMLDLDKVGSYRQYGHLPCPHDKARCKDSRVKCPPVDYLDEQLECPIDVELKRAQAYSPDEPVRVFYGNERRFAWLQLRNIGNNGSTYYLRYEG